MMPGIMATDTKEMEEVPVVHQPKKITDFFSSPKTKAAQPKTGTLLGYFKKDESTAVSKENSKTAASEPSSGHVVGGMVGLPSKAIQDDTPDLRKKDGKKKKLVKGERNKTKKNVEDSIDQTGTENMNKNVDNKMSKASKEKRIKNKMKKMDAKKTNDTDGNSKNTKGDYDISEKLALVKENTHEVDVDSVAKLNTNDSDNSTEEVGYLEFLTSLSEDPENPEDSVLLLEEIEETKAKIRSNASTPANTPGRSTDNAEKCSASKTTSVNCNNTTKNSTDKKNKKSKKRKADKLKNKKLDFEESSKAVLDKDVSDTPVTPVKDTKSFAEVSYDDFLSQEADNELKHEENTAGTPKSDETEEVPAKKSKPGIERFFVKKTSQESPSASTSSAGQTITVKAIIHQEPSPNPVRTNGSRSSCSTPVSEITISSRESSPTFKSKRKSNVVADENDIDLSIIELGKVDIEPDKKSKKKIRNDDKLAIEQNSSKPKKEVKESDEKTNKKSENKQDKLNAHKTSETKAGSEISFAQDEEKDTVTPKTKEMSAEAKAFLTSASDTRVHSKKRTQAVLSFTKQGFTMKAPQILKPEKEPEDCKTVAPHSRESDEEFDSSENKQTKTNAKTLQNVKRSRKGKKDQNVETQKKSDSQPPAKQKRRKIPELKTPEKKQKVVHSTPVRRSPRASKSKCYTDSTKKRVLRSVYSSKVVREDDRSKSSKDSLKIRLTRVGKKDSTDTDQSIDFTKSAKKSKKVSADRKKAQKLLEKAKSKKVAKKTKTNPPGAVRKSARQSALEAQKKMNSSTDDDIEVTVVKTGKGSKVTGKNGTTFKAAENKDGKVSKAKKQEASNSSRKGSPVKKAPSQLAPIFQKKQAAKTAEGEKEKIPAKPLTPEEMEALKKRRAFLMSGIPETLRKQQEVVCTNTSELSYPPWPKVNHVHQKEEPDADKRYYMWDLPVISARTLKLKPHMPAASVCVKEWQKKVLFNDDMDMIFTITKDFNGHLPIQDNVVKALLAEIAANNTGFPVKRIYRALKSKHTPVTDSTPNATEPQPDTLPPSSDKKSMKRKPEESELDLGKRISKKRRKSSNDSVILVEDDEDKEQKETNTKRRSLRTRKSREKVVEEDKQEPDVIKEKSNTVKDEKPSVELQEGKAGKDLLWTEKYQPSCSAQILGNTKCVNRLKSWLTEWKERMDRETRRLKIQMMKLAKQKKKAGKQDLEPESKSNGWWTDDESDFALSDLSDSDYEDEECGLNNTMLITGPHGIGKTATVYALAQELGYKVFEVNASEKRNGKQILARLQEATQSHLVSKQNLDSMVTPAMATAKTDSKEKAKEKTTLPNSFANFFTKKSTTETVDSKNKSLKDKKINAKTDVPKDRKSRRQEDNSQTDSPKRGRRRKGNDDEDFKIDSVKNRKKQKDDKAEGKQKKKKENDQKESAMSLKEDAKGLNLSSVSLILFEEVDVVFDDDKGFHATIQEFMATTKKPIILTTADNSFISRFEGRLEQVVFKTPLMSHITSYLQVLCLCEGIRTDYSDIYPFVNLHRGDIRSCVNDLQFWVESGASVKPVTREIVQTKVNAGNTEWSQDSGIFGSQVSRDGEEEEELVRRKCRRVAAPLIGEDSCDSVSRSPQKITSAIFEDSSKGAFIAEESQDSQMSCVEEVKGPLPPVHTRCLETYTGSGRYVAENLMSVFQGKSSDNSLQGIMYQCLPENLAYNNLTKLLLLPTCQLEPWTANRPKLTISPKPRKRIRLMDDLYDSEESTDGNLLSLNKPKTINILDKNSGINKYSPTKTDNLVPRTWTKVDSLSGRAVDSLSKLYDSFSDLDCLLSREMTCESALGPGLSETLPNCDNPMSQYFDMHKEITAYVQARQLNQCNEELKKVVDRVDLLEGEDVPEARSRLSLPVSQSLPCVQVDEMTENEKNLNLVKKRATDSVTSCLPLSVQSHRRTVAVDYITTLRRICKMEQFRKATNRKRRFFHYLDAISLPLKQSAIDTLCSTF